jgi:hypothetical protein
MPMLTPTEEKLRTLFVDLHADTVAKLAVLEEHLESLPRVNRSVVLRTRRNLQNVCDAAQAHIDWYDANERGIKVC